MKVGVAVVLLLGGPSIVVAAVGDPQIMTDHPYFAGELSCSTVERTMATAFEQYRRRTGMQVESDQDKALAIWFWRCTHFWHTEDAHLDYWGSGLGEEGPGGGDMFPREYWLNEFSMGSSLCGAAHCQLSALLQSYLGPGRARVCGVTGHNSHEVWLTGGAYGQGRWALLDADMSIVVFDEDGKRMCSLTDVMGKPQLLKHEFKPQRQQGWPLSGVSRNGASGTLRSFRAAEYNAGYLGAPPVLYLPEGMSFRRYPEPGLGKEGVYCFWAANYNQGGIPGPARDRTWARDPAAMYRGPDLAADVDGPTARYGNGVFTYRPDFGGGGYRQALFDESATHVTFDFGSPYIIACTPADTTKWGVYKPGARNGLVLTGRANCPVALSVDWGASWRDCGAFRNGADLTDLVKGRRQYLLRLGAGADKLADAGLEVRTIVQINPAVFPHLKAGGSQITYLASGEGLKAVGPFIDQAKAHVVEGGFDQGSRVVMKVASPRGEPIRSVFAAAHVRSEVPPDPNVRYQIEASFDGGKTWRAVVRDWRVVRRAPEPDDFWSQGFLWGQLSASGVEGSEVLVRFSNDGEIRYGRCEVHLAYAVSVAQPLTVRYGWQDEAGEHVGEHTYAGVGRSDAGWRLPTGKDTVTHWVEFVPGAATSQRGLVGAEVGVGAPRRSEPVPAPAVPRR
ncbi:MAG TPA: hypothetical protein VMZ31_13285 [Phycisphaerae bacterium]|nr:hypothetical protein [Phycisphaerae bacterium]